MAHPTLRSPFLTGLTAAGLCFWLAFTPALVAQESPTPPPAPTDESDIDSETEEAGGNAVQEAAMHYFAGERLVKQAEKNAAKLASTPPEKREKIEAQIKTAYEKAEQEFLTAIQQHKQQPKAYAALGDLWRKTGRVERSFQAYDAALVVSAKDAAALAGRAEAHLALGQLPQAKSDYDNVAALDKKRAATLRTAMRQWLEARRQSPGNVTPEALNELETWLATIEKATAEKGGP